MRKPIIIFLFTILSINIHSQVKYERGYYIDNSDSIHECFIKNKGWKNNPTEFKYKISENSEPETITIKSVKEFGIYNHSKYIRSKVKIDITSQYDSDLTKVINPIFNEEELFLKVLIEGEASLYSYECETYRRYFYKKDTSNITQLIYKKYLNEYKFINENETYKLQLWSKFNCPEITEKDMVQMDYTKKDLMSYFQIYNQGSDSSIIYKKKNPSRSSFQITIRPGINLSSLEINETYYNSGTKFNFRIGLETELILLYNQNKWSIILEPTFQSFSDEDKEARVKVDYKSLEIPLGCRHYFFIGKHSQIFINGVVIYDVDFNSKIDFTNNSFIFIPNNKDYLDVNTYVNYAMGVGFKPTEKIGLEFRYHTKRNLLVDEEYYWGSKYKTMSVIFGYTF